MKRITILFSVLVLAVLPMFSQNVNIPDANFLAALIEAGVDTDEDGQISFVEAENITSLEIGEKNISDLTGIESFGNLDTLYCGWNSITSLDFSSNKSLKYLNCTNVHLSSLNVINCENLEYLRCYQSSLSNLDLSKNPSLKYLYIGENELSELDISINLSLVSLECYGNMLSSIDVTKHASLKELICSYNQLTSLDISNNHLLEKLHCEGNMLTSLDVSNLFSLEGLYCFENQLANLDVSNNPNLEFIYCQDNLISSLDISSCTNLWELNCNENQIIDLDFSGLRGLAVLRCANNELENIDFSDNGNLSSIECGGNKIANLDLSECPNLYHLWCGCNTEQVWSAGPYSIHLMDYSCSDVSNSNLFTNLNLSNNLHLMSLDVGGLALTELDLSSNSNLDFLIMNNLSSLSEVCVSNEFTTENLAILDTTDSPNVYFTTECTIGVKPNNNNPEISIYPNPSEGIITIDIQNPIDASLEIYNINGSMIYSKLLQSYQERIDISAYPAGLYFFKVRQQGELKVEKVILQ